MRHMPKELRFALHAVKKNIMSSAELRASFWLTVFGMATNNIAFVLIWSFFIRSVGPIGGWNVADVIALNGFAAFCYGAVFSSAYGLRQLPETVSSGAFDRYLLSPKNLISRVATGGFNASGLGDMIFGLTCLVIYAALSNAGLPQVAMIAVLAVITIIVFFSLAVVTFSSGFLFADSSNVSNGIFEIFFTPSLYSGGMFQGGMRFVFTFIVPSLLIGGLPVEAVKYSSWPTVGLIALLAAAWFGIALLVFRAAVRRYESANFMTFGN